MRACVDLIEALRSGRGGQRPCARCSEQLHALAALQPQPTEARAVLLVGVAGGVHLKHWRNAHFANPEIVASHAPEDKKPIGAFAQWLAKVNVATVDCGCHYRCPDLVEQLNMNGRIIFAGRSHLHACCRYDRYYTTCTSQCSQSCFSRSLNPHAHTHSLSVALQYVERLVVVDVDFANTQLKNAS